MNDTKNLPGYLIDLPVSHYGQVHDLQLSIVDARHAGRLGCDVVILLEHAPVFTIGRRGGKDNLLVPSDLLDNRGVDIVTTERGGDITYHGPGQLVVYILMDIVSRRMGVTDFVAGLETVMVRTAAQWGVAAKGDTTNRGAWVGQRKLGSVGIAVRRGITFHGLALNVKTDLEPFQWIHPCGLERCKMTTLDLEAGKTIDMKTVRWQMAGHIGDLFGLVLEPTDLDSLKEQL